MRIVKHKNKYRIVTGYLWWKKVLFTAPTFMNALIWIKRRSRNA